MKKTIVKNYCDICKIEKREEELKSFDVLTYSTFSSADGAPYREHIFGTNIFFHNSRLDVCRDCAKKIAVVQSVGVQSTEYEYTGGYKGQIKGEKY